MRPMRDVREPVDAAPVLPQHWAVAALTASLCLAILMSAWIVFPPTAGDDALWMVAAVNQRAGRGAVNFYSHHIWLQHPPVEGALMAYPLLYVFLVSAAMMAPTYAAAIQAAALMKVVSLVMLAWGWTRLASRGRDVSKTSLACLCGGLGAEFSLLYTNYRPEVGVVLVLSVFVVLLSLGVRGPAMWGVALGLVAGTNPMCGLIFSGISVLFFSRERSVLGIVRAILVTGFVSALTFLGVLATGWGIADTLRVTANASHRQFYSSFNLTGSLHYLYGQKQAFLGGLPGSVGLAALAAYPFCARVRSWPMFYLGIAWLMATVLQASLLRTEQVYNVFAFLPLVVAFFVARTGASRRWQAAGAVSLILAACGSFIALAALCLHVSSGIRYAEAQQAWMRLRRVQPIAAKQTVSATTSLWGLAEDEEDLSRFRSLMGLAGWDADRLKSSPILVQQMFGSTFLPDRQAPPPELRVPSLGIDHVLAVDLFQRRIPRFLGIPLGRSVPGWGFAAYVPRRGSRQTP
jgi:hypothetical protein